MNKPVGIATFGMRGLMLATVAFAGMGAAPSPAPAAEIAPVTTQAVVAPAPVASGWSAEAASQLVAAIERARGEGLRPSNYNLAALRRAMAEGPGASLDIIANTAALSLAHDYYFGRISDRAAFDWHIARPDENGTALADGLQRALAQGVVGAYLHGLLPSDARYAALRDALADAGDTATRNQIRANMERSRWMPRGLGEDYLYVNVPSYRLQVIDGGAVASSYTVVVGAPDTPTPLMATAAPSLVVNPWWNVPQSIIRKSNMRPGRPGFIFASANGGMQVRQPPGPRNALGKIKINLINDQAIYLHDTPAKAGFAKDARALSHGCVRVKDIDQLAAELMRRGGDEGRLDTALATSRTATLALPRTWNVYLVYFTMDRNDAGQLVSYDDPYGRDTQMIAKLDGPTLQIASN